MTETIAAAAIKLHDVVYSVEKPARHHHVFEYMYNMGVEDHRDHTQGFVTDTGRFVDRKEALAIAKAANQLIRKTSPEYLLFSEDLW